MNTKELIRLALRNVIRAKRRTAITTLAMAFALGVMIIYLSLMDGFTRSLEENGVSMQMGMIQVHADGYLQNKSIYKMIQNADEIETRINARGFKAVPRLFASGLIAKGETSAGVMLSGLEPQIEKWAFKMPGQIMEGSWLDNKDPKGVVIGKRLAKSLSARVGDEVVLVTQAADGSMANDLFIVRGILKSINEGIDRAGFMMTQSSFRDFMVIPEGVHEIAVMTPAGTSLDSSLPIVKGLSTGLDVKSWKQLNPALANLLMIWNKVMILLIIITFIAISIVVLNAMLMAVFERIREYGVMKALGVTPYNVYRMVIVEILFITIAAAIIGLAFGIPLAINLQTNGIDMTKLVDGGTISGVAVELSLFSYVTAFNIVMPLIIMFLFSIIAGSIPAVRAARLDPVKAIHHT